MGGTSVSDLPYHPTPRKALNIKCGGWWDGAVPHVSMKGSFVFSLLQKHNRVLGFSLATTQTKFSDGRRGWEKYPSEP